MLFCPKCNGFVLAKTKTVYPNNEKQWYHYFKCKECGHKFRTVEHYEFDEDFYSVFPVNLKDQLNILFSNRSFAGFYSKNLHSF